MKVLVTGSSGHAGSEIAKLLQKEGYPVLGIDQVAGPSTDLIADINDWQMLDDIMPGTQTIIHTASLHAPQVATHSREDFIKVNIQGTLKLLEQAKKHGVQKFIYTSTTSVYGEAMRDKHRTVWVDENLTPIPRDIYDITKLAAEQLCADFYRQEQIETLCLRVSRFWEEPMPNRVFYRMYRGLDVRDVAIAHKLALVKQDIGFEIFNISAKSPFNSHDLEGLKNDAKEVIQAKVPGVIELFEEKGWELPSEIDRVYVIEKARHILGFRPWFNIKELLREFKED